MKRVWLLVSLFLSGCGDLDKMSESDEQKYERLGLFQKNMDHAHIVCRDGVEYLLIYYTYGSAVTPHLQRDGKPYLCNTK